MLRSYPFCLARWLSHSHTHTNTYTHTLSLSFPLSLSLSRFLTLSLSLFPSLSISLWTFFLPPSFPPSLPLLRVHIHAHSHTSLVARSMEGCPPKMNVRTKTELDNAKRNSEKRQVHNFSTHHLNHTMTGTRKVWYSGRHAC